jgi:integrase
LPIPELYKVVLDWFNLAEAKTNGRGYFFSILDNRGGNIIFSKANAGNHRNHKLNKRLRLLAHQLGHTYMSAHKFRRGHTFWGLEQSKDMKQYKAISLNLGHQDIRITDQYYSAFSNDDTAEILASLAT